MQNLTQELKAAGHTILYHTDGGKPMADCHEKLQRGRTRVVWKFKNGPTINGSMFVTDANLETVREMAKPYGSEHGEYVVTVFDPKAVDAKTRETVRAAIEDAKAKWEKSGDALHRAYGMVGPLDLLTVWQTRHAERLGLTPTVSGEFPATLRKLIDATGSTSDAEFAESAGISRQHLHHLLTEKRKPSWEVVQKIASALKVSTDVFREKK